MVMVMVMVMSVASVRCICAGYMSEKASGVLVWEHESSGVQGVTYGQMISRRTCYPFNDIISVRYLCKVLRSMAISDLL